MVLVCLLLVNNMSYSQNVKKHLFETAHSGYYSPVSTETVNLVPNTWTKYTITDGDLMREKTIEPLCKRDIYLANKIDEIAEYKKERYIAGNNIYIDNDYYSINVIPFDKLYEFSGGIIENNYNVNINEPNNYGSIQNRLKCDTDGLYYEHRASSYYEQVYTTGFTTTFGFTDSSVTSISDETKTIYVSKAEFNVVDGHSSGTITNKGFHDYYLFEEQMRKHDIINEYTEVSSDENTGFSANIFDPTDLKTVDEFHFTGGKNYIDENASMIPKNNVLFIYE